MGGRSKPSSVVGYKYLLGMEMGFAHGPADALRQIWIDDRLAWSGRSTGGRIVIHKPELFGGESREGGVSGYLDLRMGLADQDFNDYLGQKQAFPTGAARGVISAALRRMYLGTNPYLKKWELVFERILLGHEGAAQWRPDIAMIPGEPLLQDAAIYIAFDVSGSMDGAPMAAVKSALSAFLEGLKDRVSPDWPSDILLVGWGTAVRHRREARIDEASDLDALIAWVEALPETHEGEGTDYAVALSEADVFFNGAGHPVPHPYQEGFTGWGDRGEVTWAFPSGAKPGKRRIAILLTDAETYSTAGKAAMQAQIAAVGSLELFGVVIGDGSDAMLEGVDNTPGDGIARVTAGDADALLAILSSAAGLPDLNAVHMLREQYTNPVWGCGVPEAEMGASWDAAATAAKAEGFGLSLKFGDKSRADAIEDIERHLGAVTYDDPLTGLTEIRLIRDDYDPEALPVLDGSNILEWSALSRRLRSEAVNSVTVTYRSRASRATEPRTAIDIAAQAATGRTIPHRAAYPGVRRGDLAARLAERDLRALGSELLSATVTVTLAAGRGLHKGQPVILHSPKRGVENVVCRVMEVERPGSGLGGVRLDLLEDVFSMGDVPVIATSGAGYAGRSTATSASAASPRVVQEAPYRELVFRHGEAETDERLADADYLGALSIAAGCARADAFDALVAVDAGGGFEEVGGVTITPAWTLLAGLSGAADDVLARVATDPRALELAPGAPALLGLEWVTVEGAALAETEALGPHMVLTLGRGCLDTVPVPHAAGAVLIPAGGDEELAGYYIDGETAAVRLRTRTGRGTLPLDSAPEDEVLFAARAIRPYPAGRLQLGGAFAPAGPVAAPADLTWAHRDRTTQTTGAIEDYATGDIGPEPGVAYRFEERAVDPAADLFAGADAFATRDLFADDAPGRLIRAEELGQATARAWDPGFAPDIFAAADLFGAEELFGAIPPGALYAELRVIATRDGHENWTIPAIRARRLLAPADLGATPAAGETALAWRPREAGADEQRVYRSETKFTAASLPAPLVTLGAGAAAWTDATGTEGVPYWYAIGAVSGGAVALSAILQAAPGAAAPAPAGFSGVVVNVRTGQSNDVGRHGPVDPVLDATDPDILAWDAGAGALVTAADPLPQFDGTPGTVGPGLSFAKRLKANHPGITKVVIIPAADGGTGHLGRHWNRLDPVYAAALARIEAGIAATLAAFGTIDHLVITQIQGEDDLDGNEGLEVTADEFRAIKGQHIEELRRDISIAGPATPVVFGGLPPEWTAPANLGAVNAMYEGLGGWIGSYGFASSTAPDPLASEPGDAVHYSAASAREMGRRMADALDALSPAAADPYPAPAHGDYAFLFDATGVPDGFPLRELSGNDAPFSNRRVHIAGEQLVFRESSATRRIHFLRSSFPPLTGQDFRLEVRGFVPAKTSGVAQGIAGLWNSSNNHRSWLLRQNGAALQFYWSSSGSSTSGPIQWSGLSAGGSYDIDVVRVGTALQLWVNGVQRASTTLSAGYAFHDSGDDDQGVTLGDYDNAYQGGNLTARELYARLRSIGLRYT